MADTGSSFPPPPPTGPDDFYTNPAGTYGPPPMSGLAIAGFVLSVLICIPGLSILGVILSFFGIFVTSPEKRRGRGLAIAGLIVGIIVSVGWGAVGYLSFKTLKEMQTAALETSVALNALLQASEDEVPAEADIFYTKTTPRFKSIITKDKFTEWIEAKVEKLGQLQGLTKPALDQNQTPTVPGQIVFRMDGTFVNGPAGLRMFIMIIPDEQNPGQIRFAIDDLQIDGESPLP